MPKRVGPPLLQKPPVGRPALRLQKRIVVPGLGRINVEVGWNDVVITNKCDGGLSFLSARACRIRRSNQASL